MANNNYDFELALALLKKKSYEELWSYALAHAKSGDSYAQCLIAFLYQFGFGVPTDLDEAERWLRYATHRNNSIAWNNLGTLLLTKGEKKEAKRCYQKAVELGFTPATHLAK